MQDGSDVMRPIVEDLTPPVDPDRDHWRGGAGRLGVDLDSPTVWQRVQGDADSALASGARGTPTFFINGRRHYGAYDLAALSAAVRGAGRPGELAASRAAERRATARPAPALSSGWWLDVTRGCRCRRSWPITSFRGRSGELADPGGPGGVVQTRPLGEHPRGVPPDRHAQRAVGTDRVVDSVGDGCRDLLRGGLVGLVVLE
jgi:hypothetical protein